MLVPYKIQGEINPTSGWVDLNSPLYGFGAERLFRLDCNKKYLAQQVLKSLTDNNFMILKGKQDLVPIFLSKQNIIVQQVQESVERFPIPLRSDQVSNNPIIMLNMFNRDFLQKTTEFFINNCLTVAPELENINESGFCEDDKHSQYTTRSYSSGVWKPEELFLNHPIARNGTEWKLQDVKAEDPYRRWGGYRFWNVTPHTRNYSRTAEGLKEGGTSDRRVQINKGYGKDFEQLVESGHKKSDVFRDTLMYYEHYMMRTS